MEISFIHMQILVHLHVNKTTFHMKGFALPDSLWNGWKTTQKWPIELHHGTFVIPWLENVKYHSNTWGLGKGGMGRLGIDWCIMHRPILAVTLCQVPYKEATECQFLLQEYRQSCDIKEAVQLHHNALNYLCLLKSQRQNKVCTGSFSHGV